MNMQKWANAVICLIVFCLVCLGLKYVSDAPDVATLLNPEPEASSTVHALEGKVELEFYEFDLNQVTKEVDAIFEIANHSNGPIRDIELSCDYRDREGALRGRGRWVVYETLGPGKSDSFKLREKSYISYRVVPETIECSISDLDAGKLVTVAHNEAGH